jgi:hypothetical protein
VVAGLVVGDGAGVEFLAEFDIADASNGGYDSCEFIEEVVEGVVEEDFLGELVLLVEEVVHEFDEGVGGGSALDVEEGWVGEGIPVWSLKA